MPRKSLRKNIRMTGRGALTSLDDYRPLGASGLRVSPLCLVMGSCAREEAEAMFMRYVNAGGNFIDTANKYQEGETEEWLGDFIQKRGRRDDLVIATKYSLPMPTGSVAHCGNNRKNMMQALQKSLERLKTDYIDLFYVHFWDHSTPETEIMRSLDDLVRSGKVHYLGISATPAWEVMRCNTLAENFKWSPFVAYQGRHNIGDRSMEREIIPMCKKFAMGVMPWGVLGGGKYTVRPNNARGMSSGSTVSSGSSDSLAKDVAINGVVNGIAEEIGRPPTQVLLNWELQHLETASPIIGVRKMLHLEDNLGALKFTLTSKQIESLNNVSKYEPGYPVDYIGTSYKTSPWVRWNIPSQ